MANDLYNVSGAPAQRSALSSQTIRNEFSLIAQGLDKFPAFAGNAGRLLKLNAGGTGFEFDTATYLTQASAAATYKTIASADAADSLRLLKSGDTMTGALLGFAGTAALPGYAFAGDANNGWWSPAVDEQAWSLEGVERMRLAASGLGIGTSPSAGLHVFKDAGSYIAKFERPAVANNRLAFYNAIGAFFTDIEGGSNEWAFSLAGVEAMRLDVNRSLILGAAARAGIGNGADRLAVAGSIGASGSQFNVNPVVDFEMVHRAAGGWQFYTDTASKVPFKIERLAPTDSLVVGQASVRYGGIEVGYRDIPRVGNTGAGNLTAVNRGKCVAQTDSATLTVVTTANGGPSTGGALCVYNDSAANMTLAQGVGVTLRLAGTATTGNRTLAPRGSATLWYNSDTEVICSGSGLT